MHYKILEKGKVLRVISPLVHGSSPIGGVTTLFFEMEQEYAIFCQERFNGI